MNYISMDADSTLHFPATITFDSVPGYQSFLEKSLESQKICFDLSGTELIHSSFAGFLIHAKNIIEKNNRQLTIKISSGTEKTFRMLEIYNHLRPNIIN